MSDNVRLLTVTSEWLESRRVESMHAHSAATLERLAKSLKEEAGQLWSLGREQEARYLRDIMAPRFTMEAKELRAQQNVAKARTASLPQPQEVINLADE